ncbi:probable methylcrotonoyl-CoA carboxylase beta chain, mitochondrial [Haliotis rubra]|uniref:probable methylcrotonoyl-CoA carboxylase beta chain, mitochondrial n=1 Tax=Haliotis rubra TaxID=36100 RepID=UPI001EE5309C|nr:probable methylcrotonoyl-CoA carboxylase beta chain, mitochondrial [Haliotis rubra]
MNTFQRTSILIKLSKTKLQPSSSHGSLSNCFSVNNSYSLVAKFHSNSKHLYSQVAKHYKMKPYPVLDAEVDVNQPSYSKNIAASKERENLLLEMLQKAQMGGGQKAIERHTKRNKKLLVQDRLKLLLDNEQEFLELSPVAGLGMQYGDVPKAGVVTGIGRVMGRYCMIVANDATVKGGSVYPVTLKKQLRAQEIAHQNRLPCIYVVDSGGAFLPLQAEIFNPGGQTFYNEAVLSSMKIHQVAIVCGSCTAGGAYVPTMADEAVIVHKMGTIFLGGPPLVQAATGEIITAEDLGGATLHCKVSGCTDHFAADEDEAFSMGRDIIASLNVDCASGVTREPEQPLYDSSQLPGLVAAGNKSIDMHKIIGRVVDGSRFREFKKMYGETLITGFGFIEGHLTGIIANQGRLSTEAAVKGCHFVQLCAERHVPIVFLQNTDPEELPHSDGVAISEQLKAQGKMFSAVSCASVPKITVIVGNGIGPTHYIMGGRAVSPNFLFTWPNAVTGIMEPKTLASNLAQEKAAATEEIDDVEKLSDDLREVFTGRMSALFTSTRVLDDGVILPQDTRKVVSQCLGIVSAYLPRQDTKYPVLRM